MSQRYVPSKLRPSGGAMADGRCASRLKAAANEPFLSQGTCGTRSTGIWSWTPTEGILRVCEEGTRKSIFSFRARTIEPGDSINRSAQPWFGTSSESGSECDQLSELCRRRRQAKPLMLRPVGAKVGMPISIVERELSAPARFSSQQSPNPRGGGNRAVRAAFSFS